MKFKILAMTMTFKQSNKNIHICEYSLFDSIHSDAVSSRILHKINELLYTKTLQGAQLYSYVGENPFVMR